MKLLVEQNQAFSAAALWVALGARLMGFNATIQAQMAQIKGEIATKKANNFHVKVKKVVVSFEHFKSGGKMSLEAWWDIVRFLVPLYDKKMDPSKVALIVKMKEKLESFKADFGTS